MPTERDDAPDAKVPDISVKPPLSFVDVLRAVDDGDFAKVADKVLRDAVSACVDMSNNAGGKPKAKLTLTLDFTLDDGKFDVTADVSSKLPKPKRRRSIFWPDRGSLSPSNPRQFDLGLDAQSRDDALKIPGGTSRVSTLR